MRPLCAALICVLATPAAARIPIVEGETVQLSFAGYLRSFTAWAQPDVEGLELDLSLQTTIARAELRFSAADVVTIDVHSRLAWSLTSPPIPGGVGLGAGVSVTPPRTLDTSSVLVGSVVDGHRLEHDLDRFVVRLFLGEVDVSIGRQAVTWGTSQILKPADLWTTFSPFDLDTSQKRGVDAVRAVAALTDTIELDAIIADRGRLDETAEDLSGGVRATFYLPAADVWVGAAKAWEQVALMAGVSAEVGPVKLRSEVLASYGDDGVDHPRATVGVDWFHGADFLIGAELHYSGLNGRPQALSRGEIYLQEEWYTAVYATYKPHELVTLTLSPLLSIAEDTSAVISWSAGYQVGDDVDLGVGAFHGVGAQASEFGQLGHMVYIQLSAFL